MAGEPEWPEDVTGEEITLSTYEPAGEAQNYSEGGSAGYTSRTNITANSDGALGYAPKTDDTQALDLWTIAACIALAAMAACTFIWVRMTVRHAAER